MDDGDAVLAAIRVMRERLQDAVYFSTSALNITGGQRIESPRVEAYYAKCEREHQAWDQEFRDALLQLVVANYPVPDHWHDITLAIPQIAFSEIPVARYEGGEPIGVTWVIGGGFNPEDAAVPEWIGGKLPPGDTIRYSADEPEADTIAGAFDDSAVSTWKSLLGELQQREQHLTELRLQWKLAAPDRTDNKTDSTDESSEFSDPPDGVLVTGRYVRDQMREIKAGRRAKATKKALIAEVFDQKGWSETGIDAMAAQLQPKRYGWILTVPPLAK